MALERTTQISTFTGYAVRRWPSGQTVFEDVDAGELLSLHPTAQEAATTVWQLRSINGAFNFGVIRIENGERRPLRYGRDRSTVLRTYDELASANRKRGVRHLHDGSPAGAAA